LDHFEPVSTLFQKLQKLTYQSS